MLSIQAWPRQANTLAPPPPHERPPPFPPLWLHQTRHQTVSDKNRLDQNRLDQTRPDQTRPDQLGLDGWKRIEWTRPGLISSERDLEVEVTGDLLNLCPICSWWKWSTSLSSLEQIKFYRTRIIHLHLHLNVNLHPHLSNYTRLDWIRLD